MSVCVWCSMSVCVWCSMSVCVWWSMSVCVSWSMSVCVWCSMSVCVWCSVSVCVCGGWGIMCIHVMQASKQEKASLHRKWLQMYHCQSLLVSLSVTKRYLNLKESRADRQVNNLIPIKSSKSNIYYTVVALTSNCRYFNSYDQQYIWVLLQCWS